MGEKIFERPQRREQLEQQRSKHWLLGLSLITFVALLSWRFPNPENRWWETGRISDELGVILRDDSPIEFYIVAVLQSGLALTLLAMVSLVIGFAVYMLIDCLNVWCVWGLRQKFKTPLKGPEYTEDYERALRKIKNRRRAKGDDDPK